VGTLSGSLGFNTGIATLSFSSANGLNLFKVKLSFSWFSNLRQAAGRAAERGSTYL
jgi:hypothetical protein